jgi:hypothetical protein
MTPAARCIPFFARILAIVCVVSLANPYTFARRGSNGARVHLAPNFASGQTFRYAVQTRIETTSIATGPIRNMGGPKQLNESVGVVIRLDVLSAFGAPGAPASARIRATYEKSAATSNAGYDPDVAAMEDQYKKLAGQTVEFTLQADGKITGVTGLKDLASDSDPSRAAMLNQWLSQVMLGASLPKQGIAIGEKWSSQQPLENVPLDGLFWKTTQTYERDEPCAGTSQPSKVGSAPAAPAASSEQCAIIMSHSEIVGGHDNKERTPEVFRQNGLRASGVWTGTADSLAAISLRTAMVSSVTQTGATHMDFTIMTAVGQNRMRYAGDTRTQSEITLLSPSAIP